MKVIGILGGLSPESTRDYYEHIIHRYYEKFGDYNYPEIIIYSVNFQKYVDWTIAGNWNACADDMVRAFNALNKAGAEFGIIAANTPHKVFDDVNTRTEIPLISIVDATAEAIKAKGKNRVGLLGTIFTMTGSFFIDVLKHQGIEVLLPEKDEMDYINHVIYDELTKGVVEPGSKAKFIGISSKLVDQGAEGIILGCTELPMILTTPDVTTTLFNTAEIHAEKALDYAVM